MPYEIKIKNFNYNNRQVKIIVHNRLKKICGIERCLFIIVILSCKFSVVLFFKTDFSSIRQCTLMYMYTYTYIHIYTYT